jgi:hypothetical protein
MVNRGDDMRAILDQIVGVDSSKYGLTEDEDAAGFDGPDETQDDAGDDDDADEESKGSEGITGLEDSDWKTWDNNSPTKYEITIGGNILVLDTVKMTIEMDFGPFYSSEKIEATEPEEIKKEAIRKGYTIVAKQAREYKADAAKKGYDIGTEDE